MGDYVITRSTRGDKKYMVTLPGGKTVNFGQAGAEDFTMHKDPERWRRYLKRHGDNEIDIDDESIVPENYQPTDSSKEDWSMDGVDTAGFWSRWYAWSYPDVGRIQSDLKKRFGINLSVDL